MTIRDARVEAARETLEAEFWHRLTNLELGASSMVTWRMVDALLAAADKYAEVVADQRVADRVKRLSDIADRRRMEGKCHGNRGG